VIRARGYLRRGAPIDWLIVGLGNPGREYERTRHNVGFLVADLLAQRWQLSALKQRFRGRLCEGRVRAQAPGADTGAGAGASGGAGAGAGPVPAPHVALLWPQTFMNDAGRCVGPARGLYHLELRRVLVIHDEIDLPFGDIRSRLGGGLAGHNGLKSLKRELGGGGFWRVRVGVGRPASTDPEIVAGYVLGRFAESQTQVDELVSRAADEVQRLVLEDDGGVAAGGEAGAAGGEAGVAGGEAGAAGGEAGRG
jgi:PTH1 family peptidyl-tRNA hydrolase